VAHGVDYLLSVIVFYVTDLTKIKSYCRLNKDSIRLST